MRPTLANPARIQKSIMTRSTVLGRCGFLTLMLTACTTLSPTIAAPTPPTPSLSTNAPLTDEAIDSIAIAEEQFRSMLDRAYFASAEGPRALELLGIDKGCRNLASAKNQVVAKYLPDFRKNLVTAYRDVIPENELREAIKLTAAFSGDVVAKYFEQITSRFRATSDPLINASVVDLLTLTKPAVSAVNPASADVKAHIAAIKATNKVGAAICESLGDANL